MMKVNHVLFLTNSYLLSLASAWDAASVPWPPGRDLTGDTADMTLLLGHAFDHQAALTRLREAVRAACSSITSSKANQQRFVRGADLGPTFSENLQNIGFLRILFTFVHVEQAARAASEGRVSGA